MDDVTELLRATRFSGGIFLDAEFSAPWCIDTNIDPRICAPHIPEPYTFIVYHYVSAGRVLVMTDGQPPVAVGGGEIVILPRNDAHRLGSGPGLRAVDVRTLIQPGEEGSLPRIVHGGGGERAQMLCGFLANEARNDPLVRILPIILKVAVADAASSAWIESSMRFAAHESAAGLARSPTMLAKLAELLFIEAVRRYLETLPAEQSGWRAGIRDPAVGRALALLHRRLNHHWTAEQLAQAIGMSRSAFADRFTRVMGESPMRYLAQQRLQFAAQRLQSTGDPVLRIALDVGYESEAAFNRAFKRSFGAPPAAWRHDRALADNLRQYQR